MLIMMFRNDQGAVICVEALHVCDFSLPEFEAHCCRCIVARIAPGRALHEATIGPLWSGWVDMATVESGGGCSAAVGWIGRNIEIDWWQTNNEGASNDSNIKEGEEGKDACLIKPNRHVSAQQDNTENTIIQIHIKQQRPHGTSSESHSMLCIFI